MRYLEDLKLFKTLQHKTTKVRQEKKTEMLVIRVHGFKIMREIYLLKLPALEYGLYL